MLTKLLTFDLATCTGWCWGTGATLPTVGHIVLPSPSNGARGPMFLAFARFLTGKIGELRADGSPVAVGFEQPILPRPFMKLGKIVYPTNIQVTLVLQGLAAVAELICEDLGVECGYVDVTAAKKELAGFGGAAKDDMVYVARKVGLTINVHDEADAFAVFLVGLRHYNPAASREFDRLIYSSRGAML